MKTWFEVYIEAGPRTRVDRVFGTLGYALLVARSLACHEQAYTELSFYGDIPCVTFDKTGGPAPTDPLVLPLLSPVVRGTSVPRPA